MGDRNNPIKFGPEWLRNMSREGSAGRSINQNSQGTSSAGSMGGATASSTAASTSTTNTSKVLLAKLRYGREEMLALYDRNAEAPNELKHIETLYQPRGKQPVALNNTFEDDMRDNLRSAPPIGGMTSGDRFGIGRGAGRGIIIEGRGRSRASYINRQPPTGRGGMWHMGPPRMPGYSGGPDDEGCNPRQWNNNSVNSAPNRNSGDQTDWANKMYRNKRQGNNTNWRQPQTRDDGEEWRSSEPGRNRQLEKWDFRDWGERPSGERTQSWSNNRRTWIGGESQTEENLPEWAAESAECGGTFDSTGAFHGYSNDDTNLPKHQDSTYPLTRSHTHGSFPRPKAVEEGSDEWWASEKAKKLSPKRFDASEIKFKKQSAVGVAELQSAQNASSKSNSNVEEPAPPATPDKVEPQPETPEPPETNVVTQNEDKFTNKNNYKSKYGESKTFDALMRSDINMEEASDERGNFQSVIIAANNSLRQKHQHLVPAANENVNKTLQNFKLGKTKTSDMEHGSLKMPEDLLVDNIFGMTLDDKEILSTSSTNSMMNRTNSGMSSSLTAASNALSQNQNSNMQMNLKNSGVPSHVITREMLNNQNFQAGGIQQGHPTSGKQPDGLQSSIQSGAIQPTGIGMQSSLMQPGVHASHPIGGMPSAGLPSPGIQPVGIHSPRIPTVGMQGSGMLQDHRLQTPGMQPVMQQVGITNSALNASLGLPIGPNPNIGHPRQGLPPHVMPNVCMSNNMAASMAASGIMGSASMQAPGNIPGFQPNSGLPGMSNNVGSSSIFRGQNSNNPSMGSGSDMPMSNHTGQNNIFPMHGLQQSGSQGSFGNSIYGNNSNSLAEQWYYEDPERNIQGPFSSKDMYNWYRAGFFSPSLMVRRACENMMRPLGTYGPVVPFAQMDMIQSFPISGGYESRSQGHENMLHSQSSLSLDVSVRNINNMNRPDNAPMRNDTLQFGSVGIMPNQSYPPQQMVDSLWGQPSSANDLMWMQQPLTENRAGVNNLSMFFWEQPPSAIPQNSLLPEDITKEMKTEDEILAQLRASQNVGPPPLPFINDQTVATHTATLNQEDCFPTVNATPNLEELHKLIQKDTLTGNTTVETDNFDEPQQTTEIAPILDHSASDTNITKPVSQNKVAVETKPAKQAKDSEKAAKNKDSVTTKKNKKSKEDKKEENIEAKPKEEEVIKAEKRSQEPSPSKSKKEDKSSNKKELDKEKKEWIKEGFTIVKGADKNVSKDNKKKAEDARAADEAERKRKEEEKIAVEDDKKKKQAESVKKQQEQQQQQQQRQATESVVKKAPWSAVANQTLQAINREGLSLQEIQRLEREKKLEQMKEQQQMMQIIAQQQAAALAREQEMQAGLGWAKKKGNNISTPAQSLAEIQAEARKQAAAAAASAAAAAAAHALEEAQVDAPLPTNHVPWGNTHNGGLGGFWDTQLNQPSKQEKSQEPPKPEQKKKPTLLILPKKETSPVVEFEAWCTGTLASWSSKIDVPTFVGFLKDIESPYEVKDYVKCYLGETKDSSDFARQFLERRSKLLRVGMVTPSDDLCSPAIAVNPRTTSGSDYQEVKGKGKKTKKNKMLKVDARILGFSVTASEDRINVGDIDTV